MEHLCTFFYVVITKYTVLEIVCGGVLSLANLIFGMIFGQFCAANKPLELLHTCIFLADKGLVCPPPPPPPPAVGFFFPPLYL